MAIFDTDIFVWHFRGVPEATDLLDKAQSVAISIVTYMELLQGARNKREVQIIRQLLRDLNASVLPLSENIGYRAAIYIEDYALSHGIRVVDAIIAATAMESDLPLYSSNVKHFRMIPGLDLRVFQPGEAR